MVETDIPVVDRNEDRGAVGTGTDAEPDRAPVSTEQPISQVQQSVVQPTPPPTQATPPTSTPPHQQVPLVPPTPPTSQPPTQQSLVQVQAPPPPVPPPQPRATTSQTQGQKPAQKSVLITAKQQTPKAPPASGPLVVKKPTAREGLEALRAKAAYSAHEKLNKQLVATSNAAGFVPMRTVSGRSLGSLVEYNMDWNNADLQEANSAARVPAYPLPELVDGKPLDPASPITVGQLMYNAKAAMLEVDRAVEVSSFSSLIPSPRDSGRVTWHSTGILPILYLTESPRFGLSPRDPG